MCGRHGAGLDWPEEKDKFSNNILLIFAAIKISARSYVANLLWNIFPNFLPNFRLERGI